jgi:hypothetical protein
MEWLKGVLVDICVTILIAVAYWLGDPWMWWVIAIYTGLLLIAKSMVLTGDGFLRRSQKSQKAPEWFLHLLYALNVVLLALAGWWYLMAAWVLIWLLSVLGLRKVN